MQYVAYIPRSYSLVVLFQQQLDHFTAGTFHEFSILSLHSQS
jgi:hypothetical protein